MQIQPVVLSGGSGTRLWPLSREKYPKQLLPLIGDDSLLQATVRRVEGIAGLKIAEPMVVCNEEYRFVIAEQLRLMGTPGAIVLEPFGRNTAPALTLAALAAMRDGGDPVLLVLDEPNSNLDSEGEAALMSAMLAADLLHQVAQDAEGGDHAQRLGGVGGRCHRAGQRGDQGDAAGNQQGHG